VVAAFEPKVGRGGETGKIKKQSIIDKLWKGVDESGVSGVTLHGVKLGIFDFWIFV